MSRVDAAQAMTARMRAAALYIDEHGWTQGTEQDEQGHVCLTGAVRLCDPQAGDAYIIREVLRRKGHAEDWNDRPGRSADDVTTYLRTAQITDADLADTFGPQWEQVIALVRRAAALTLDEAKALDAAWDAARDAARDAAWDAARDAAWAAARTAARAAARTAARAAAAALAVRDLIGQHGFTQEAYTILTGPWASVIGKVHPDD